MITIYQIQITNRQADDFNAGKSAPLIETKRKLMFGSKGFTPDMLQYFTPVYEVYTDDLEAAFEITNLWNKPEMVDVIGDRGHSSSVGDIFRKGDRFFMVDSFGFEELRLFNDEVEMLEMA